MKVRTLHLLLVLVLWWTVAAVPPTATSQPGPITTLPPAQPTGPDTGSCDFADRDQLLQRVVDDWQAYNVSLLVETCPNVCTLIYGDGNPDVSGIGVLISYIVQFISTLLVGPGLYYLFLFEHHFSKPFNRFLLKVRDEVACDINAGNNWITLSIMLASAVRLAQYPPIFEVDFILTLLWLQGLLVCARVGATVAVANRTGQKETEAVIWDVIFTGFVTLFTEVVILVLLPVRSWGDKAQYPALVAISEFCIYERDLPIPAPEESAPPTDSGLPWWTGIVIMILCPIALGVMWVLMVLFMAAVEFVSERWERLPRRWQTWIAVTSRRIWNSIILFLKLLPGVVWLALCIWLLVTLQGYRNDLKMTFGKQYQDSFWGFGQVAILVMLLQSLSAFGRLLPWKAVKKKEENGKVEESQPLLDSPEVRQNTDESTAVESPPV